MIIREKSWLKRCVFILLIMISTVFRMYSQDYLQDLQIQLDSSATEIPGLNQELELSVNRLPIQELIRTIAISNKINVVVDPSLSIFVTYNFTAVPAKDIFIYLCRTYNLDIVFNGKILSFIKRVEPETPYIEKPLAISYDSINDLITLDFEDDSIVRVVEELTQLSNANILVMPASRNKKVSMFIKEVSLEIALENLAFTNQLILEKINGSFVFDESESDPTNKNTKKGKGTNTGELEFTVVNQNNISVSAFEVPIAELVQRISIEAGVDFFIYSELEGNVFILVENATYHEFLNALFNTTKYTYTIDNGIYLIGDRQSESLRTTKVVQLKYRSMKDLSEFIPENLKKEISIIEFPELNSFIFSGSKRAIEEISAFITRIDKVVPLITIDVIIIDNRTGYSVSTGISAGLADEPVSTSGTVFPSIDMNVGASSINKLINSFNGFGSLNLGNVTPNFYVSLKFMEDQGIIKVRSTPKISTLNGHEATLKIGETDYYVQETTDFIINASTSQTTTKQYESVKAEFSIVITPYVSGDEQITLDVKVDQSTFTERIEPTAPPGQLSRSFSSLIRVKNNDMILLGGLEESSLRESSSGVPWISRVPILKWIFSSRDRKTSNEKLNIFIRPTVIY